MRKTSRLFRLVAVHSIGLFTVFGIPHAIGQPVPPAVAPAKPTVAEQMNQAELLDAYRNMREQLRTTQAAIVNNRFEAEATARAQAAAITEKLDAMNAVLAQERRARQADADRLEFERGQHQEEVRKSNRSVIWIASAFGTFGLAAMLFAALFQWRALNRMADVVDQRATLPMPPEYGGLPAPADSLPPAQAALSTQRLVSAINRMEQRIKELEPAANRDTSVETSVPADHVQGTG